jgi:phosphodiesterase/alkaline phosphatase D-like protein
MAAITRRSFLGGATAGAAALCVLRDPFALAQSRVPIARGGTFSQGVSCGQPSTNGITLWSRVDGLERESRVQFEISPTATSGGWSTVRTRSPRPRTRTPSCSASTTRACSRRARSTSTAA